MSVAVVLLVGWGFGWFVARSVAFEPARVLLERLRDGSGEAPAPVRLALRFLAGVTHCPACVGFWFGLALGFVAWGGLAGALAAGAAVMGCNAVLASVTDWCDAATRAAWKD